MSEVDAMIASLRGTGSVALQCRMLGSYLGFLHGVATLDMVLKRRLDTPRFKEIVACRLQEHVLRRGGDQLGAEANQFWTELKESGHPLAAQQFTWVAFKADSNWFEDVAWDLALQRKVMVLDPRDLRWRCRKRGRPARMNDLAL